MTSLMQNPIRADVSVSLITKDTPTSISSMKAQFERLAGSVNVASSDGFLAYLAGIPV